MPNGLNLPNELVILIIKCMSSKLYLASSICKFWRQCLLKCDFAQNEIEYAINLVCKKGEYKKLV